jgi:hypothetical protein
MSENPSERDQDDALTYDNWPVEGKSNRNTEWLGFVGGPHGPGAPALYEPHNDIVYQGNIDEENERIVPNPETERRVSSNETIGEVLRDIADSHGWQSLSSFAAEHMGVDIDEDNSEIRTDRERAFADATFHQRNVAPAADHQLGFFGSVTDERSDGVHTIEHEFHVYTEKVRRENGKPTAEVKETQLLTDTIEGAMQGGDAELIEENHHELVINIDPELAERVEQEKIEEYCRKWHESAVQP